MNRLDRMMRQMAAEIHAETMQDDNLMAIVQWVNAELGESPEAIRGMITGLQLAGGMMLTAMGEGRDPVEPAIRVIAAWQAQPHVIALMDEIRRVADERN